MRLLLSVLAHGLTLLKLVGAQIYVIIRALMLK